MVWERAIGEQGTWVMSVFGYRMVGMRRGNKGGQGGGMYCGGTAQAEEKGGSWDSGGLESPKSVGRSEANAMADSQCL
jgi:hypothetical protein